MNKYVMHPYMEMAITGKVKRPLMSVVEMIDSGQADDYISHDQKKRQKLSNSRSVSVYEKTKHKKEKRDKKEKKDKKHKSKSKSSKKKKKKHTVEEKTERNLRKAKMAAKEKAK